ncbi:hypothetical protein evm_003957 [Chilo suppressalis]|nr:hypothetical protein evm_003957 [Chilo suppressalis]
MSEVHIMFLGMFGMKCTELVFPISFCEGTHSCRFYKYIYIDFIKEKEMRLSLKRKILKKEEVRYYDEEVNEDI